MKKIILTASLLLGVASTVAQAQTTPTSTSVATKRAVNTALPDQAPYNTKVSLTTPLQGIPLDAALSSLARTAGLTPIFKDVPSTPINLSFKNKPFREILSTLVETYGNGYLAYRILPGDMLLIATQQTADRVLGEETPVTNNNQEILRAYPISGNAEDVAKTVTTLMPEVKAVGAQGAVIIRGTTAEQESAGSIIANIETRLKQQATQPVNLLPGGGTTVTPPATPQETTNTPNTAPAPAPEPTILRSYRVINSDPIEIAQAFSALVDARNITYLKSSGTLLVNASAEQHTVLQAMLKDLDRSIPKTEKAPAVEDQQEATYPILGDPDDIMNAIKVFVPNAQVQLLRSQNMILVRALPADQVKLVRIMNQINVAPSLTTGINGQSQQVFRLQNAPVDQIINQLQAVYGSIQNTRNTTATTPIPATPVSAPQVTPSGGGEVAQGGATASTNDASDTGSNTDNDTGKAPSATTIPDPVQLAMDGKGIGGPTITADPRSNSIIATGTTRQLQMLGATIQAIDIPVRQVKLNVRIEQIDNTAGSDLGIKWNASAYGVQLGGGSDGLSVGWAMGNKSLLSLGVKLDALQREGKSNTITNTTLMMNDNRSSKLTSGGQLHVAIQETSSTATGGTTTSKRFQKYDYGLNLNFKPRVTTDGRIELMVDTAIKAKPSGDYNTYFTIDERSLVSTVSIGDGQTVILGGIVTDENGSTKQGVPGLSKIPLLGNLFSKTTTTGGQSTLLFIITPQILDGFGRPVSTTPDQSNGAGQQTGVPVGRP